MRRIAIAVHGGVGNPTSFLRAHEAESHEGIREALAAGYYQLKKGRTAVSAVEAAVMKLEDNPLFNAGRGSALNSLGEVEMDAAIMEGKTLKAGGVSIVRHVKNPILLARHVLAHTPHVLMSGEGALQLAKHHNICLEPETYFLTEHQLAVFAEEKKKNETKKQHGTVGAVAIDKKGNLAAATSTGGTSWCLPGRIGDSCIVGAGCYANNQICAISGTGDGEYLITRVVAHSIAMYMQLKGYTLQVACDKVIHAKKPSKTTRGDVGVVAIDKNGQIGISFNTKNMRRGYIDMNGELRIDIFKTKYRRL